MAYFTSLQNYIDSVTARFNKPKRSLLNDGILKQDVIDALTDTAKYADDVKVASEALNANFVARSLNQNAVCWINGTTGNDAYNGSTQALSIKTMARAIALYSGKAVNLAIYIAGTVEINANMTLSAVSIQFDFYPDGKIWIRKLPTNNGSYYLLLDAVNTSFLTFGGGLGIIETEAHGGNVTALATADYNTLQGGIRLLKLQWQDYRSGFKIQTIGCHVMKLVAGAYTTVFAGFEGGINPLPQNLTSYIYYSQMYSDTPPATASYEVGFDGNKLFPRAYTPTSSTDAKVIEGEMVADNNFLFRKNGGIIKKIAWAAF